MMKRYYPFYVTILTLILTACLQGPWSYAPKDNSEYKGIYTEGTLIADRAISNVCFEKLLSLDEYYTNGFAFYQDSRVTITGKPQGGISQEIILSPQPNKPNCFNSDANFIIDRGESYRLRAEFTWDSSGTLVETVFKATANIPTKLIVNDTATVNEKAFTEQATDGNMTSPQGIFDLITGLPQEGQDAFNAEYEVVINEYISQLALGDTVAATNIFTENFPDMNATIGALYQKYEVRASYVQGDSIFYLTGVLNTTSHYYNFDYSEDVASLLVTQAFTDSAIIPQNAFSAAFAQFGGGAANQYPGSTTRRLIHLPNVFDSNKEYSIFDSLTVTNTWYMGGPNKIYFYGYEQAMTNYILTYIREHSNPKVQKKFNIENGRGVFAGAIVDSFEVFILNPASNKSWTYFETKAAKCNEVGWESTVSCQDFELEYCREVKFDGLKYAENNRLDFDEVKSYNGCTRAAYMLAWIDGVDESIYLEQLPQDKFNGRTEKENADIIKGALTRYCAQVFFQDSKCADLERLAHSWASTAENSMKYQQGQLKDFHRQRCKKQAWTEPTCDWALRSFCVEEDINSDMMCVPASDWCDTQTNEVFCGEEPS